MTDAVEFVNGIQNFVDRRGHPPPLGDWQAEFLEQRKNFGVKIDIYSLGCPGSVKHDAERSFRHDGWVELLEGTGRGVAGICKQRAALLLPFVVKSFEAFPVHVDFAAHFQKLRRAIAQTLRDGANRLSVWLLV